MESVMLLPGAPIWPLTGTEDSKLWAIKKDVGNSVREPYKVTKETNIPIDQVLSVPASGKLQYFRGGLHGFVRFAKPIQMEGSGHPVVGYIFALPPAYRYLVKAMPRSSYSPPSAREHATQVVHDCIQLYSKTHAGVSFDSAVMAAEQQLIEALTNFVEPF